MPRTKRVLSQSGLYHVMLRGINRQRIFEDDDDRESLLASLDRSLKKSGAKLFAWCLMNNHVHMLLKEGREPIGSTVKRMATGYVRHYNTKNGRVGALFQDRFRSEAVPDERYFLTVLRYIHQNPVKAKLCKRCSEWKYSSCNEYLGEVKRTDTTLLFSMMSPERFRLWTDEPNSDLCLDIGAQTRSRLSDEDIKKQLMRLTGAGSVSQFQALGKEEQDKALCKLKAKGVTIKQLQAATGLTYYAIQKA